MLIYNRISIEIVLAKTCNVLNLDLHNIIFFHRCIDHVDEVRSIIQKATKDVEIESSLKTYEEVWLSKVFELKRYSKARASSAAVVSGNQEVKFLKYLYLT